jgi:copper(I)-binding protein
VIGSLCLLVLIGITATVPAPELAEVTTHILGPARSASPADSPPWYIPDGVPVSLSIQNDGDLDDRLLGAWTPAARSVGIRRSFLVNGRRQSAPVPEGLVIPADTTTTLELGKSHLALYGLRADLVQGQMFPLTLRFERAGEVTVVARIRRRVDAAGTEPLPQVSIGDLTIARASAPPAAGP